jgi:hypothetical protein
MLLNVQKLLLNYGSDHAKAFSDLQNNFGVYAKASLEHPNLIQFSYDQIESSKIKSDPIVRECRGLVLDNTNNSWRVVARPFDRFFNWGENVDEDIFDWSGFAAQEKIDGSMMILYNCSGTRWKVSTKGSIDASGNVGDNPFTFRSLFWQIFYKSNYNLWDLDPRNTYIFELTSKWNRVVTSQENNEGTLTLIGVRDRMTGQEFHVDLYRDYFSVVRSFPMDTIEEILEATKQLSPDKQEGFVIVDKNFNRIKVKSEKYVMIHHVKDTLNPVKILDLVKVGEQSEILAYFPDLQKEFDRISFMYNKTKDVLQTEWTSIDLSDFENKKAFAIWVNQSYGSFWTNFFFAMYDKKVKNSKEWINRTNSGKLLESMEKELNYLYG